MDNGTADRNGKDAALVPVPEILTTISHEVRILSDSVKDVQDLIGNLVVAGAFGGSHSLYELQSLDRLYQSLDAISDFLGGVAKSSSPDWKVDVLHATQAVKLAEVSDRLKGIKSDDTDTSQSVAGNFDDFEDWSLTG